MSDTTRTYNPQDFGDDEVKMMAKFNLQLDDARSRFISTTKPRLDRAYKLYSAYNGDRAKEIKEWQCIGESDEILSPDGWKKMGELKKGNPVFSYDIKTGAILLDEVKDTVIYDLEGEEMVSIKNARTDQLVTPNHRVIAKEICKNRFYLGWLTDPTVRHMDDAYSYVRASELNRNSTEYRLPLSGTYDGDLSIGGDYAELIGWFLTDGCIPERSTPYITQNKPETLAKLRTLLISMRVEYREWSRPKGGVYHDEHRFYFPKNGEVMRKILPLIPGRKPTPELWGLTLSEKRRLLDGICYGDGSRRPDGQCHTVHKPYNDFKEWFQVLLHLMGMRGTVTKDYVNIAYSDTTDVQGNKHISTVKYTGRVWSVSTGRTNYIARRNGHVFITGNSNIFIPYIHAVVETLMPRILDARPDFVVQGRTEEDQFRAEKLQCLTDYTWEIAKMDETAELVTRSALVFGTGFLQTSWKKDERKYKFFDPKVKKKSKQWVERSQVFYDAPFCEWVDNYSLWYDWRNPTRETKQFWFKRLVLNGADIRRRYPAADPERLEMALNTSGDLTDYASIRFDTKLTHELVVKGADFHYYTGGGSSPYQTSQDPDLSFHEVFEWSRPFDDYYGVMVNNVPVLKDGGMPLPYDHKESVFVEVPFIKFPGEFEGMGLTHLLENPQVMLNMIKNQRLDAATLSIHNMWIVNPLANIDKNDLVSRPFGIIYTPDPAGVREVQFSDIKPSSYREEELLKGDMTYASGVDDFSMGVNSNVGSATAVRHLRESTLERVRLFVNHLGSLYSVVMRHFMSHYRQFMSKDMTIRIIGKDGLPAFPLIEKDDLMGEYDFKAAVIPSIAGKNDIDKKQGMDLFQLLVQMPFVDPQKLTSKVLQSWNWSLDSVAKSAEEMQGQPMPGQEGVPGAFPPEMMGGAQGMPMGPEGMPTGAEMSPEQPLPEGMTGGMIPPDALAGALKMLGGNMEPENQFAEASAPINLLAGGPLPPTAKDTTKSPAKTTNTRGMNRKVGGKVNTNVNTKQGFSDEPNLANKAANIQR